MNFADVTLTLQDLQTEGIVGVLNGLVYSLNGLPDNSDVSITYRYFAPEAEEHTIEHSDKVGQSCQCLLST